MHQSPQRPTTIMGAPPTDRLAAMRTAAAAKASILALARARVADIRAAAAAMARTRPPARLPLRVLLVAGVAVMFVMSLFLAVDLTTDRRSRATFVVPPDVPPAAVPPAPPAASLNATASDERPAPRSHERDRPAPQRQAERDWRDDGAEIIERMADQRAEMERMAERLRRNWDGEQ